MFYKAQFFSDFGLSETHSAQIVKNKSRTDAMTPTPKWKYLKLQMLLLWLRKNKKHTVFHKMVMNSHRRKCFQIVTSNRSKIQKKTLPSTLEKDAELS